MIGETLPLPAEPETIQGQWLPATMLELDMGDIPRLTFRVAMTLRNGNMRHGISTAFVTEARLLQRLQNEVRPGDKIEIIIQTDWEAEGIPTTLLDFVRCNREE